MRSDQRGCHVTSHQPTRDVINTGGSAWLVVATRFEGPLFSSTCGEKGTEKKAAKVQLQLSLERAKGVIM